MKTHIHNLIFKQADKNAAAVHVQKQDSKLLSSLSVLVLLLVLIISSTTGTT